MKLIEITKQILNEAAPKNPLSLFRSIFKAAGINLAEVEAALLLGLKQIDPKIVSLTKATPEQIEKAFKTTAFRKYSQTIARNYIANNDKLIEGILKKHSINTTSGSKAARLEIANTLGVNKSIADDIFVIKKPKKVKVTPSTPTQTPPKPTISPNSSDEELWSFFQGQIKDNRIKNILNKEQGKLFVREIRPIVDKTLREQFPKLDLKLTDLKNKWSQIPPSKQQQLLKQTQETIKNLGLKKGMSLRSIELFTDSLFGYIKGLSSKEKLYASLFMSGISFGIDGLVFTHEKEFSGHFGLPFHTTGILKLLAAAGGFVAGGWPGIILSTILLLDSASSGVKDLYKHLSGNEKKSGESGVFNDNDLKTDDEEDKLKRIEGGFENK